MPLSDMLKEAIKQSVGGAIATQVAEIAAGETRFALQQHEADLTALIRAAVSLAVAEMLSAAFRTQIEFP